MSNNKDSGSFDEQKVASFLQGEVRRVETASNAQIDELKQLAKLFKRNVPFSRRSYVLAQLVKSAAGGVRGDRTRRAEHQFREERGERFARSGARECPDRGERAGRGDRRDAPAERHSDDKRERPPRSSIPQELSDTIFVGIGKSRSVHPRDMVGLLVGVAGLEKARIGDIRVLPNYSFVQLYAEDCQKAIDALDGYEYRGRRLSVSFSRKKDEESEDDSTKNVSLATQAVDEKETVPAKQDEVESVSQTADDTLESESEEVIATPPQEDVAASESYSEPPVQDAGEGFETSDDGQVRSHFGDGAAY